MQLWNATYRAMGQSTIAGLSLNETMWYFMLAETIVMSKPRLSATISESVKDGSIAYLLNKPYDFLLYQFSVAFGDGAMRLVFNAIVGSAIVWLMVGPPPDLLGIPLVLIAIALGWLIDFCMTAMIGLTAFVTEDVAAFDWIYAKFVLILGGVLIPLDFFPDWLGNIAKALPFAYATYGPARLFVTPDLTRFAALVIGQIIWLIVLGTLLSLVYRRGERQLTINGG
ncbi:MAG: ABC-2 family transporter protein [Chloroflexi bacterium]|nr:ABC-2 family transporter protein [Chloroflexota bacterium]